MIKRWNVSYKGAWFYLRHIALSTTRSSTDMETNCPSFRNLSSRAGDAHRNIVEGVMGQPLRGGVVNSCWSMQKTGEGREGNAGCGRTGQLHSNVA